MDLLYTPKNPLPKEKQLAAIEDFYGGGNTFSVEKQALCKAGLYVFSPAPRGSSGLGTTFEKT